MPVYENENQVKFQKLIVAEERNFILIPDERNLIVAGERN